MLYMNIPILSLPIIFPNFKHSPNKTVCTTGRCPVILTFSSIRLTELVELPSVTSYPKNCLICSVESWHKIPG